MNRVQSYRDLRVWQVSMDLVELIYEQTAALPDEERYGLSSQMRRAAVSIPSNIAEGHARTSSKEFLHYLSIAQASLAELETQLEIAVRLNDLLPTELEPTFSLGQSLGKQLYALRNAVRNKLTVP